MNCIECKNFFCEHRSQSSAGRECFYELKEQGEKPITTTKATLELIDWSSFRREAAKDILCAVINGRISEDVSFAIKYADELISQLKEEKK